MIYDKNIFPYMATDYMIVFLLSILIQLKYLMIMTPCFRLHGLQCDCELLSHLISYNTQDARKGTVQKRQSLHFQWRMDI